MIIIIDNFMVESKNKKENLTEREISVAFDHY